jgi:hypothetical protein
MWEAIDESGAYEATSMAETPRSCRLCLLK